ncbi:MAG: carbonic anhydrase [Sideroxyarcus sp.]|nr:carbonic anhydrase [Sideroxyarcus sp.]
MTRPVDLISGFHRFRQQHFGEADALYRQLVQDGQTPKILMVACCDSRVDPSLVMDCAPGDLFVIRNVANLIPPAEDSDYGRHGTSAALEYGVRILGVEHIIVLGHSQCGGIRALLAGNGVSTDGTSYISSWMRVADEARQAVLKKQPQMNEDERERACEQQAILCSLDNLMTFSWVREGVAAGTLGLHGWYFDIQHGQLLQYDAANRRFEVV